MARPTHAEAAQLTARIIDVATRAFLQSGYSNASMEQIAASAGTAKRSLYARFPTKSDLFREVVLKYSGATLGQLSVPPNDNRPIADQLFDACRAILDIVLEPDVVAMERIVISEAIGFPELAQTIEAARRQGAAHIENILAKSNTSRGEAASQAKISSHLWDLIVAPAVRSAVLGLTPCKVTDDTLEAISDGLSALSNDYGHDI